MIFPDEVFCLLIFQQPSSSIQLLKQKIQEAAAASGKPSKLNPPKRLSVEPVENKSASNTPVKTIAEKEPEKTTKLPVKHQKKPSVKTKIDESGIQLTKEDNKDSVETEGRIKTHPRTHPRNVRPVQPRTIKLVRAKKTNPHQSKKSRKWIARRVKLATNKKKQDEKVA